MIWFLEMLQVNLFFSILVVLKCLGATYLLKTSDVLRKDPDTITASSSTFSYEVSCVHRDFESTFQGAVTYMLSSG